MKTPGEERSREENSDILRVALLLWWDFDGVFFDLRFEREEEESESEEDEEDKEEADEEERLSDEESSPSTLLSFLTAGAGDI